MFVVKSSYLYKTLFLILITCQWLALIHIILPELHLLLSVICFHAVHMNISKTLSPCSTSASNLPSHLMLALWLK
jgi:hypothetical protein